MLGSLREETDPVEVIVGWIVPDVHKELSSRAQEVPR